MRSIASRQLAKYGPIEVDFLLATLDVSVQRIDSCAHNYVLVSASSRSDGIVAATCRGREGQGGIWFQMLKPENADIMA